MAIARIHVMKEVRNITATIQMLKTINMLHHKAMFLSSFQHHPGNVDKCHVSGMEFYVQYSLFFI